MYNDSMDNNQTIENNEYLKECYEDLCYIFSVTTDIEDVKKFFRGLFTPAEIKDFAERWLLVKELKKGTTQRQIAKDYNMSLCKITRGSKELKDPESAFVQMLGILENKKS